MISKQKTVEAAEKYAKNGKTVCILNFASSVAPGGGVFANPPEIVARAFCEAAVEFENHFETVEFAIYSPGENNVNYHAFKENI